MARKLISSLHDLQCVPESYVLPPENRPGRDQRQATLHESVPIIDLGGGQDSIPRSETIQLILQACQEFGFFQLINHRVSERLMGEAMNLAREFFDMSDEDKPVYYSEDPRKPCRLYTSVDYGQEKVHFWRDGLRHRAHPLHRHISSWPEKPSFYREIKGNYALEMRKQSLFLLDLIREGIGLEPGFFDEEPSQEQMMVINHYPACPDPFLTLGLPSHCDLGLITILLQDQFHGLQVLKDGKWLGIPPVQNAFVVNIGHMLHIISNRMLRSAEHRVITNKEAARITVASLISPSDCCSIEPDTDLTLNSTPRLYRTFRFKEFISAYIRDTH